MTTVQSQAVATKGIGLVAAVLLCGCSDSVIAYHIDGAETEFCVPHAVDVTPARPGKGEVIAGGFAINGCWNSGEAACRGPESLVSLAVVEKASFAGRRLVDFSSDAHVREVAIKEKARAKTVANNLMAVPDSVDTKKWFVWHVVEMGQATVADDDELMATCAVKDGFAGYFCDRKIVGPDYSVGYSFFASGGLPTSFEPLDKRIISDVEGLRCNPRKVG